MTWLSHLERRKRPHDSEKKKGKQVLTYDTRLIFVSKNKTTQSLKEKKTENNEDHEDHE